MTTTVAKNVNCHKEGPTEGGKIPYDLYKKKYVTNVTINLKNIGGKNMAVIKELIRKEGNNTLSFGNYELDAKKKVSDFEFNGDLYKVKTFKEITKLEKNGLFVYESVPGTVVTNLKESDNGITFDVEGWEDASITLELEPEMEYKVSIDENSIGQMKTNLGGKLVLSVELNPEQVVNIQVAKL